MLPVSRQAVIVLRKVAGARGLTMRQLADAMLEDEARVIRAAARLLQRMDNDRAEPAASH